MTSRFPRSDVTAEVVWRGCTADFVCDNCQFVVDLLTNRKPVKLFQEQLSRQLFQMENDACCCALDALQFLDAARPRLHATQCYSSPGAIV